MKRQCGDCQQCCKLVPVASLGKPANKRCQFQRFHVGCTVYHTDKMPIECGIWNCAWLENKDTADLSRPDKTHYVIDHYPDKIRVRDNDTGEISEIWAVQIWCDPDYPEAWRDPKLKEFMERRGAKDHMATMIRFNSFASIVVFPPSLTKEKQWFEIPNNADSINPEILAIDSLLREKYKAMHGITTEDKPFQHMEGLIEFLEGKKNGRS